MANTDSGVQSIIRNQRLKLNLTQAEVAKEVGVTEATVSRWENGQISNMRRSKIAALAKVLQISPSALIDGSLDYPSGVKQEGPSSIASGLKSRPTRFYYPGYLQPDQQEILLTFERLSSDAKDVLLSLLRLLRERENVSVEPRQDEVIFYMCPLYRNEPFYLDSAEVRVYPVSSEQSWPRLRYGLQARNADENEGLYKEDDILLFTDDSTIIDKEIYFITYEGEGHLARAASGLLGTTEISGGVYSVTDPKLKIYGRFVGIMDGDTGYITMK